MASRRPRHEAVQGMDPTSILAAADESTRRASTSSERAKRAISAATSTKTDVENMVNSYDEIVAAIDACC